MCFLVLIIIVIAFLNVCVCICLKKALQQLKNLILYSYTLIEIKIRAQQFCSNKNILDF